jgi:uncharacterized protein (TIGR02284 family)
VSQSRATGTAMGVDATASTLNQLVNVCLDGERGFQAAAGRLSDSNLAHLFESYSRQRRGFVEQLQRELGRLGLESEQSDAAGAATQPGPANVTAAGPETDEGTVIADCERAEELAIEAYSSALKGGLPPEVHVLVERQFTDMREVGEQLRSLARTYQRHT